MMQKAFGLHASATWKSDNTPVTETDMAINRMVIERVKTAFPDDGILGEEESYETSRERLWVTDPIDGTYPFTLGAPLSTFLLALVIDGQPVVGVMYDPYLDRMFWAVQGEGAYLNDQPIHVSDSDTLKRNFVVLSSREIVEHKTAGEFFDEMSDEGAVAFNFRSFAYGSGFIAAGTAVGGIIGKAHPWDVAVSKLLIEEAGGMVTDLAGNARRYDRPGNGMLASNGKVHQQLLDLLKR